VINKFVKWLGLIVAPVIIVLAATTVQAQPNTLHVKANGSYAITKHLYYYNTPEQKSLAEIDKLLNTPVFKKLYPEPTINAQATRDFYWLTFTLSNDQDRDDIFYLQLHEPWLKLARMYRKTETGFTMIGQSGMKLNFGERPYNHYDIVFPLAQHSKTEETYLLFIDNRGYNLNILPSLKDEDTFSSEEKKEYMYLGIITGIMLFNILINIFLYLSLKEKIHLLYAQYVLCMLYWMFCSISFDFQYLYPNFPAYAYMSEYVASALGLITMTNLITSFLNVTRENSHFKRLMDALKYLFYVLVLVCIVINVWYPDFIELKRMFLYFFLSSVIFLVLLFYVIAIEKIFQKVMLAWLYVIGGAFLIFGIIKHCYYILSGTLNSSMQSIPNDSQIGLAFEAIVIFLGIVYRYNLYKDEKEKLLLQLTMSQKDTLQKIVAAQEEERKRIAQDIHDDVGSTLGTLLLHISNVPENQDKNSLTEAHYQKSIHIGRKAMNDLRSISHDLLPKDFTELGIFYVLKSRVEELNIVSNIRFTLITEGNDKSMNNLFSITVYRIINELINNILKHSQASLATIQLLITKTDIMIMVEDNGIGGTTTNTRGIGMKNIYSRTDFLNGKINIDDSTAGTSIIIEIPTESHA
jgi:signal transduction histidine kinase